MRYKTNTKLSDTVIFFLKRIAVVLIITMLLLGIYGCEQNDTDGGSVEDGSTPSSDDSISEDQTSSDESVSSDQSVSSEENSLPEDISSSEDTSSESVPSEDSLWVSMTNLSKTLPAFDMRENDTEIGWTLVEIEPYETPPEASFYGFLTFRGEVTLTGTITHVNAIYDGFDFVPDEESCSKILIPDGNPEKSFFLSIRNADDSAIASSLSDLNVDESGTYSIVLTEYNLAYVPMMATNNAQVASIEKM